MNRPRATNDSVKVLRFCLQKVFYIYSPKYPSIVKVTHKNIHNLPVTDKWSHAITAHQTTAARKCPHIKPRISIIKIKQI